MARLSNKQKQPANQQNGSYELQYIRLFCFALFFILGKCVLLITTVQVLNPRPNPSIHSRFGEPFPYTISVTFTDVLFWFLDKPRTTLLTPKATKVNVIEGHPVTFYCTADGVPPPILELHFNGVLLGYFTNGKYVMEKINATDRGLYECVARNILGISRIRFFHVNVLGTYE